MKKILKAKLSDAANSGVLRFMDGLAKGDGMVHPDVQIRMKELSRRVNGMVLRRYENSLIIKRKHASLIVAAAFGMAYALKVGEMFSAAIDAGAKTIHHWSDGTSLNLTEIFGPDWIAGSWHKGEEGWIAVPDA